jgi:hypothetical protein
MEANGARTPEGRPTRIPPDHGYPAEKARQGVIILRRPWRRAIFIGGLAAAGLLGVIAFIVLAD